MKGERLRTWEVTVTGGGGDETGEQKFCSLRGDKSPG